jgi:CO dehydrogenase nickel-insertion accessory protein CooC1
MSNEKVPIGEKIEEEKEAGDSRIEELSLEPNDIVEIQQNNENSVEVEEDKEEEARDMYVHGRISDYDDGCHCSISLCGIISCIALFFLSIATSLYHYFF